ncbi:hypothetical protein VP01_1283g1 [Puccinia sorghi]|uniref:Uncharacterized protein n=1 Tax=Puccinia sorghi TaxID=27349 RepID=A0A0L6VNV3_9BASI|nr:hypothetical protein VP01_1283g1 [Puccinia sorghi]
MPAQAPNHTPRPHFLHRQRNPTKGLKILSYVYFGLPQISTCAMSSAAATAETRSYRLTYKGSTKCHIPTILFHYHLSVSILSSTLAKKIGTVYSKESVLPIITVEISEVFSLKNKNLTCLYLCQEKRIFGMEFITSDSLVKLGGLTEACIKSHRLWIIYRKCGSIESWKYGCSPDILRESLFRIIWSLKSTDREMLAFIRFVGLGRHQRRARGAWQLSDEAEVQGSVVQEGVKLWLRRKGVVLFIYLSTHSMQNIPNLFLGCNERECLLFELKIIPTVLPKFSAFFYTPDIAPTKIQIHLRGLFLSILNIQMTYFVACCYQHVDQVVLKYICDDKTRSIMTSNYFAIRVNHELLSELLHWHPDLRDFVNGESGGAKEHMLNSQELSKHWGQKGRGRAPFHPYPGWRIMFHEIFNFLLRKAFQLHSSNRTFLGVGRNGKNKIKLGQEEQPTGSKDEHMGGSVRRERFSTVVKRELLCLTGSPSIIAKQCIINLPIGQDQSQNA